ncbi:MAG: hypothetical protein GMKNLPBB_02814 [Myxococcota bacterium]|nr:hypothetical protein [Myxococcota bacterium]
MAKTFKEKAYEAFSDFFDKAERKRRWVISQDVPWELAEKTPKSEERALCAETFAGVEMYLPDYIHAHLDVMRQSSYAQLWFAANWGYEESKHSLSLREYLMRTGQRTPEQMDAFTDAILNKKWKAPFDTSRKMTLYAMFQEMATCVIYLKQQKAAQAAGDELLSAIYHHISRDEIAHTNFYTLMSGIYLEEDRAGTLADLKEVFTNFRMPADDLVPDYESRVKVMRSAGIDRAVFINEVVYPVLKKLEVTRTELFRAKSPARTDGGVLIPPSGLAPGSAASAPADAE